MSAKDCNDLDAIMHVTKNNLKKEIHNRMLNFFPDAMSLITKRLIAETMIYLEGYIDALKEYCETPINKDEMQRFLYDIAFNYVKKELSDKL